MSYMGDISDTELKPLLDEANRLLDDAYKRIEELEEIIKRSKSEDIYAILIVNDCAYHRLIEKFNNELICIDCGLTYYIKK